LLFVYLFHFVLTECTFNHFSSNSLPCVAHFLAFL
jgi:hypothetical protein